LQNDANISIDDVPSKFGEFLADYMVLLRDPKLKGDKGLENRLIDSQGIVSYLQSYKKPHDYQKGWGYE
jgi:hypothetical protein